MTTLDLVNSCQAVLEVLTLHFLKMILRICQLRLWANEVSKMAENTNKYANQLFESFSAQWARKLKKSRQKN